MKITRETIKFITMSVINPEQLKEVAEDNTTAWKVQKAIKNGEFKDIIEVINLIIKSCQLQDQTSMIKIIEGMAKYTVEYTLD